MRYLGFSEGEAALRSQVAGKALSVPEIIESLEKNLISLTVAGLLCPHLTQDNAQDLLSACQGFSKRKVEEYLAGLAPKPLFNDSIKNRCL